MAPLVKPKLFPDIEVLLINWLPAPLFTALAAQGIVLAAPPTVTMDLPLKFTEPSVRVTRISGTNHTPMVDRPVVDLDVFTYAFDLCALTARVVQNLLLFTLKSAVTPDGIIQNVTTTNGPRWLPDVNQNVTRYNATYEFSSH